MERILGLKAKKIFDYDLLKLLKVQNSSLTHVHNLFRNFEEVSKFSNLVKRDHRQYFVNCNAGDIIVIEFCSHYALHT